MFCFHKYDKVQKDSYQYCKRCGVAIVAPCIHDWEKIKTIQYFGENVLGHLCEEQPLGFAFIYECTKCKETRQEKF